jgi:hypothetical protein
MNEIVGLTDPRKMPENWPDSVLIMGEEGLPVRLGYDFLTLLNQQGGFEKSKKAKEFAKEVAGNPDKLVNLIDYYQKGTALALEDGDLQTAAGMKKCSLEIVGFVANQWKESLPDFEEEVLGKLLHLAVKDANAHKYQTLITGLTEAETDPARSVNVLYKLCLASLKDDETAAFVLRMLNYDTAVYRTNSPMERYLLQGLFSGDDNHLVQSMEIDAFINLASPVYLEPEKIQSGKELKNRSLGRPAQANYIKRRMKEDPKRFAGLASFYSGLKPQQNGFIVEFDGKKNKDFPYNLLLDQKGRLLRASNELWQSYSPLPGYKLIATPMQGTALHATERENAIDDIAQMVISHFKDHQPVDERVSSPEEVRTAIEYLCDRVESVTQIGELMKLKNVMINRLRYDFRRPLSPRGNEVKIRDPKLVTYGYTKVLFKKDANNPWQINTDVYIGNHRLPLAFDRDYNLINPQNGQRVDKGRIRADSVGTLLMQCWILGHLEELLCKETDELVANNVSTNDRASFQKGFLRVGHTRVVKREDFVPNERQRQLATDEQGWDILAINERRENIGLLPLTYVKRVEASEDKEIRPPVRSFALQATDSYRQIIS